MKYSICSSPTHCANAPSPLRETEANATGRSETASCFIARVASFSYPPPEGMLPISRSARSLCGGTVILHGVEPKENCQILQSVTWISSVRLCLPARSCPREGNRYVFFEVCDSNCTLNRAWSSCVAVVAATQRGIPFQPHLLLCPVGN